MQWVTNKMAKSGFVTLAGCPNVGKSTLITRLVGSKIAITSHHPQTTRNRIVGIHTTPERQIVLIDTPGVTNYKAGIEKVMTEVSVRACLDTDLTLFITDASNQDFDFYGYALRKLRLADCNKILVINKIDLVKRPVLLKAIDHFSRLGGFKQIIPISAKTGENVHTMLDEVTTLLPEGPKFYPDQMVTDQPEQFVIGEIIREKAFLLLQQELPYSTAVMVDHLEEGKNGMLIIYADIIVERQSQKGIVVGKGGSMVKKIGQAARKDLELRLNNKIYLELRVKVQQKWSQDHRMIEKFGYGSK